MTMPCSAIESCIRTWCCWCGGEDVDDPVDRLGGRLGVQRGEDEVAGLSGGQRGRDRLEVAHLADEDHVGVLAQRGFERDREVGRVGADLALVDDALLCAVQELDRVLDREDVLLALALIRSTIDASEVDLPEPVGPVTRTKPRGLRVNSSSTAGSPSSSRLLISCGMRRKAALIAPRWKKQLTRNRATPGIA